MSLTQNNCRDAFVEAMRPIAKENVDRDDVKANLGALGQAVLTITQNADVISNASNETNLDTIKFWQWIQDVETWLQALSQWQIGVANAFKAWQPTQPADQTLQAIVSNLADPGLPPAPAPTQLQGKIT